MRQVRFLSSFFALTVLLTLISGNFSAKSAELESFRSVFAQNLTGSFALTGNTNQTCSTTLGIEQTSCQAARNFNSSMRELNNDAHVMRNIEQPIGTVDKSLIFNSSANEISIPRNSKVVSAFLYWFGTLEVPTEAEFGIAPNNPMKANQVLLAGPNDNCQTIAECTETGIQVTESLGSGISGFYAAHADVTKRVSDDLEQGWTASSTSETAKYTVANIQSAQGVGTSAGWSLIVIYTNSNSPLQHIELQSGFSLVAPRSAQNLTFSDFDSPITGDVMSSIGLIGIDGDAGTTGDSLTVHSQSPTLVSDYTNDANNVMNSSISTDGRRSDFLTGQTVGQSKNTFGIEADRFTLTNAVARGSNSVRLNLNSTVDSFYVPAVILATPLAKSNLQVTKYISTVTQGGAGSNATVTAGDTLEYTIVIASIGTGVAKDISLGDTFPSKNLTNLQTVTPGCAVLELTLTCSTLGDLSPLDSPITVVATATVKSGSGVFENFATANFGGNQGPSTAISNTVTAEYLKIALDLGLTMKFTQPVVQAGESTELEIKLSNYGPFADDQPKLRLTIPPGLSPKVALPAGCELQRPRILCDAEGLGLALGDSLNPGQSLNLTISFMAKSGRSSYRVFGLAQTGATDGDTDLSNNFATALVDINHPPVSRPIRFVVNQNSSTVSKLLTNYISDPDFDSLSVRVIKLPNNIGRLVIQGTQLKFKVAKDWHGATSTTYEVSDGRGGISKSRIYVVVKPAAPDSTHHCRGFVRTGC